MSLQAPHLVPPSRGDHDRAIAHYTQSIKFNPSEGGPCNPPNPSEIRQVPEMKGS